MARPGYHDPAYDPVMVTGEATPLDEPWQEKIARLLREVRDRMNKGGVTPGHPLNIWKKVMDDQLLQGQTGLMAPPDSPPMGIGTAVLPDPEAMSRWGRGDAPYTMGEEGVAGRLPMLKPGRAADAMNIAATLPLGTTLNAPGFAGIIRKKGDLITPDVAKTITEGIIHSQWDNPFYPAYSRPSDIGPVKVTSDEMAATVLPEIREKFAKYLAKIAGGKDDPLQAEQRWTLPSSSWYDVTENPLQPAVAGEPGYSAHTQRFRREVRPEELIPETGKLGTQMDEIVGASLDAGYNVTKNLRNAKRLADVPGEDLDKFRQIADMLGGDRAEELVAATIPSRISAQMAQARQRFAEKTGIGEASQDAALAALPEGAVVGAKPQGRGQATREFEKIVNSEQFREYLASLQPEEFQKKSFPDLVKGFNAENAKALKAWERASKGTPISPGLTNPRLEWQDLTATNARTTSQQLIYEGSRQNICVGMESYCNAVESGDKKVFSLRDKETNKPYVTVDLNKVVEPQFPPAVTPEAWVTAAIRNAGEQPDPAGYLRGLAADVSYLRENDDYYTRRIFEELGSLFRGEKQVPDLLNSADSYLGSVIRDLTGRDYRLLKGRYEQAAMRPRTDRFFKVLGAEVQASEPVWKVQQVKGMNNAVEGVDPALKAEVKAFFEAHPEFDITDSGDFSSMVYGEAGGKFQRYPRNVLEQIKEIYDPEKSSVATVHGRGVLKTPEDIYLAEGRDVLRQGQAPRDDEIDWNRFYPAEEMPGPLKTEIARRLKSAGTLKDFVGPEPELSVLTREVDPKTGKVNRTKEALRRWILKEKRKQAQLEQRGTAVGKPTPVIGPGGNEVYVAFTPDRRYAFFLDDQGGLAAAPVNDGVIQFNRQVTDLYDVIDDDEALNRIYDQLYYR